MLRNHWTIIELERRARLALGEDVGQPSGRVSERPSIRTIRLYTTLGILDRPARMVGRTAEYTIRHLLQLVAIKRLQAEGWPLEQIKERLAGLSDARLRRIAQVPEEVLELRSEGPTLDVGPGPRRREPGPRQLGLAESPSEEDEEESNEGGSEPLVQGVQLAPGVTLLLSTARPVTPQAAAEIRQAAEPVLRALSRLALVRREQP